MSDRFTATKYDADKPPMDLIPWEAMTGVARVLDFGRQKYSAHNWRKGFEWARLSGACLRHIFAWLSGEDCDPESGLSHIDHALCCLMFLSAHVKSRIGKDDRAHVRLAEGAADIKDSAVDAGEPKRTRFWKVVWQHDMQEVALLHGKRYCDAAEAINQAIAAYADYPQKIDASEFWAVSCDA